MAAPFNPGERIRFTTDGLGVFDNKDVIVNSGDEGRYAEPRGEMLGEGWHYCTVERDGAIYVVPVHEAMFERVA